MTSIGKRKVVGITASHWEDVNANCVSNKYIEFVRSALGATPLILPVGTTRDCIDTTMISQMLSAVDGILLTGGNSNIKTGKISSSSDISENHWDEARDEVAFEIVRLCVDLQKPLLGICRGLQEINVALGGEVGDLPSGMTRSTIDHMYLNRFSRTKSYVRRHLVTLQKNSPLVGFLNKPDLLSTEVMESFLVNSQHRQGITDLSVELVAEAFATDGTIEAVRHSNPCVPVIGVQWHPEWQWQNCALDRAIISNFVSNMETN